MSFLARASILLAFQTVLTLSALGQDNTNDPTAPSPATVELVEAQRQSLAADSKLDEASRARVTELLDAATAAVQAAATAEQQAQNYLAQRDNAPVLAAQLQADLEKSADTPAVDAAQPRAGLEAELTAAESTLAAAQKRATDLAAEPARRAERRRKLPELVAAARTRAEQVQQSIVPPAMDEPPVDAAQRLAATAGVQAAQAEVRSLEQEMAFYDATSNLLFLQQDLAQREVAQAEAQTTALRDVVSAKRREETEQARLASHAAMQQSMAQAPELRDVIQQYATRASNLAEMRRGTEGLDRQMEAAADALTQRRALLETMRSQLDRIRSRIQTGGRNSAVAVLLRRYQNELPNISLLEESMSARSREIPEVELLTLELTDRRRGLGGLEQLTNEAIKALQGTYSDEELTVAAEIIHSQLRSERDLLDGLISDYSKYMSTLMDINGVEDQLIAVRSEFKDFINENILWSGGSEPISVQTLRDGASAFSWLLDRRAIAVTGAAMREELPVRLPGYVMCAVLIALLFLLKYRTRSTLVKLGETARKPWHAGYAQTPKALGLTLLAALPPPVLPALLGWVLQGAAAGQMWAASMAAGLYAVALVWLVLEVLRQLLYPGGIAEAHFDWVASKTPHTRRLLTATCAVLLPLLFVVFAIEAQRAELFKISLGRMAFVLAMLVTAAAQGFILRHLYHLLRERPRKSPLAEWPFLRMLLLVVCVGVPLLFAGMAIWGYYYTALQLSIRLFWTFAFLVTLLVALALTRRWLVIARRRIAIAQAKAKRAAQKSDTPGNKTEQEMLEEELDLVKLDTQTQRLAGNMATLVFMLGLYLIWVDILPALRGVLNHEIWSTTATVQEVVTLPEGATAAPVEETAQSVTYGNLLLFVFILGITIMAVKNLPSLLEIILLQRLKLGSGERYATLAVTRYVLMAVGGFFAFQAIGIGWGNVQWLVAAIGLGLGFGLQEIFANFISGLILLFERPVRVGDIVTIGDSSGVVSKIRIRATTVTNWDRKELVIPNKELITAKVLNWTLVDNLIRTTLIIGVGYKSDPRTAFEVMDRVAKSFPEVLTDPKPNLMLNKFSPSTVDFELQYFTTLADSGPVKHNMHIRIKEELQAAGIELAYPQQDLHIRSGLEPLAAAWAAANEPRQIAQSDPLTEAQEVLPGAPAEPPVSQTDKDH